MKLSSTTFILLGSHHGFKRAAVAATSSPTYAPTVTFEFFGPGYCADSRSRFYSTSQTSDFVNSTAEDCSAWCLQNPDNLLGFSFSATNEDCYCEFDGGELPSPRPAYMNPPVTRYESGFGKGSIQQTTFTHGGTAFDCYVYPDIAPPSLFSKVGNGECIDSEGNGFSYFGRLNSFDETIDQQCEDYCSQNLVSTFVGFETHVSFEPESLEPDTECRCLFKGGQLPSSSVTNYTNGGLPDVNMTRSGDGIITNVTQQTNDDFGFGFGGGTSCYSYNIASQTDAPTYLPTYLPTTYLPTTYLPTTYLPTYLPTNSPTSSPTATPSQSPTVSPSASPSKNPTQAPSFHPSSSPSNTPTDSPTHMPTKVPTLSPLFEPEEPGLRSSPPVTVGPTTTAPSSQPLTSGPTSCYSGKASKNAKNAKVTDGSSKSSKSNYPCNGKSSKSESYSGKSSKSNSSSGYTSPKSLKENSVQGYSLRY
eukprot:scaffold10456_cov45-Cyclotella_meneghiniana.AAC.1